MPEDLTPPQTVALLFQLTLLISGIVVLWRAHFSPAARLSRESRLAPWMIGGFEFMAITLAVLLGGFFGQVLFGLAVQTWGEQLDADLRLIIAGAGFQGGLLTGVLVGGRFLAPRLRSRSVDAVEPPPPILSRSHTALGAAAFAAAIPLLMAVNVPWTLLVEHFGWDADRQELVELFARADSPAIIIVVTTLAVFVAPVVEELIFRAGLFRFMRTRTPRVIALGVPAVLFASLHGNLAAFVPLVALGLVFAIAYERTGRIAVPIIAHGLFNLNTILLLLIGVDV